MTRYPEVSRIPLDNVDLREEIYTSMMIQDSNRQLREKISGFNEFIVSQVQKIQNTEFEANQNISQSDELRKLVEDIELNGTDSYIRFIQHLSIYKIHRCFEQDYS